MKKLLDFLVVGLIVFVTSWGVWETVNRENKKHKKELEATTAPVAKPVKNPIYHIRVVPLEGKGKDCYYIAEFTNDNWETVYNIKEYLRDFELVQCWVDKKDVVIDLALRLKSFKDAVAYNDHIYHIYDLNKNKLPFCTKDTILIH